MKVVVQLIFSSFLKTVIISLAVSVNEITPDGTFMPSSSVFSPNDGICLVEGIHDKYPLLNTCEFKGIVPTWIITDGNESYIHRFFDSSALSPSNRYLAITKIPGEEKLLPETLSIYAEIIVVDLLLGIERVVYKTLAWDTQVLSHLIRMYEYHELILWELIQSCYLGWSSFTMARVR